MSSKKKVTVKILVLFNSLAAVIYGECWIKGIILYL